MLKEIFFSLLVDMKKSLKILKGGLGFTEQIRFIPFIAFFSLFCCKFIQPPQDWYSIYSITVVCDRWCC